MEKCLVKFVLCCAAQGNWRTILADQILFTRFTVSQTSSTLTVSHLSPSFRVHKTPTLTTMKFTSFALLSLLSVQASTALEVKKERVLRMGKSKSGNGGKGGKSSTTLEWTVPSNAVDGFELYFDAIIGDDCIIGEDIQSDTCIQAQNGVTVHGVEEDGCSDMIGCCPPLTAAEYMALSCTYSTNPFLCPFSGYWIQTSVLPREGYCCSNGLFTNVVQC